MRFLDHIITVLDFFAFEAMWYWVLFALVWSHWTLTTLGVPFAMICRAELGDKTARGDALQLAEITARDLRGLNAQLGPILVTLLGLNLGFLAALGFYYGSPLAQSVFFLVMPAVCVGYLRNRLAQAWPQIPPQDQIRDLMRYRRRLQFFGSMLIFSR